jgi:hypothetical protein
MMILFIKDLNLKPDKHGFTVQICDYPGDALQGQEWERQLPLVPVPELRTNIQMEVQHLMVQFSISSCAKCMPLVGIIFVLACLGIARPACTPRA